MYGKNNKYSYLLWKVLKFTLHLGAFCRRIWEKRLYVGHHSCFHGRNCVREHVKRCVWYIKIWFFKSTLKIKTYPNRQPFKKRKLIIYRPRTPLLFATICYFFRMRLLFGYFFRSSTTISYFFRKMEYKILFLTRFFSLVIK